MVVKGIISAIYQDQKKISVILPEYDNMTTQPLPIYGTPNMKNYKVNEFVVVFVFNRDFTDAVIMSASSSSNDGGGLELGETEITAYRGDRGKVAYEHSQAKHAPTDAQKNVQTDWNETDADSDAFFKNKPEKFPPSEHNHKWDEVEEKPSAFPPSSHNHSWDSIENKPSTFPPSSHGHSISDLGITPSAIGAIKQLTKTVTGTTNANGTVSLGLYNTGHFVLSVKGSNYEVAVPYESGTSGWRAVILDPSGFTLRKNTEVELTVLYTQI